MGDAATRPAPANPCRIPPSRFPRSLPRPVLCSIAALKADRIELKTFLKELVFQCDEQLQACKRQQIAVDGERVCL